jgi:peroxiredoxin
MRDDYSKYRKRDANIVVVARHDDISVKEFWTEHKLPFIGIPDPSGYIAGLFGQQWKALKLGLMPALFIIDKTGRVAYAYYSNGMSDIPADEVILREIDNLPK